MLESIPSKSSKRLSLNLDVVAKPKVLVRVKTLSGSKYVKPKFRAAETTTVDSQATAAVDSTKTPDAAGSFYADTPDIVDDEQIDSAVDFFSLPTPDLMKTFQGPGLKVNTGSSNAGTPAANTPTLEGRSFAEETSLVIQHTGKPTPDLFDRTPQLPVGPNDSLSTPVVDPNQMQRNPLAGHVYGMAPPISLSHEAFISSPVINFAAAEPTAQVTAVHQDHQEPDDRQSPLATHTLVNAPPAYHDYQDDGLSSSTSSYAGPSSHLHHHQQHLTQPKHIHGSLSAADHTMLSHASTFTELTNRPAISNSTGHQQQLSMPQYVHALIDDSSVPTVVQDHFHYSQSPSMSAASPASLVSNDSSSFDSKELLNIPGPSSAYRTASGNKRKSEGASAGSNHSKKPRLTKKQQFVELQQREQFLITDNEELRRRVEGMTEGCKKLKQMLMERMTSF